MACSRALVVVLFLGASLAGCGSTPDAPDAAPIDASRDAPACRVDADCDDGQFCDGVERCSAGTCTRGAAMHCDDGIACTTDACSESLARCVFRVPDVDGDGSGAATCLDNGGMPLGDDCDDTNALRFPGNPETCDTAHVDEDCNAATLGGQDLDADGFVSSLCCDGTTCGDDCDDSRDAVHVGATEVCNGIDDDCDGTIDEGVSVPGFVDADRDGYGDMTHPRTACGTSVGFSVYGTDCVDTNPAIHPGAPEICDGLDDDCDPTTAIDAGATTVTWYRDADGDGFGNPAITMLSCAPPVGYAILGTDCDDGNPARNPGTAELCNGIDDDCNGVADYVIAPGNTEDDDRDGSPDAACADPRGADCDDHDAASGPGSMELCDGRDNDCDSRIDENVAQVAYYRDGDGDGFGSSGAVLAACNPPVGFARRGGDCDDANHDRFPGALESCNAIDDDCDTAVDEGSYAAASCSAPHAQTACSVGTCSRVSCESGYQDCDGMAATGCEASLASDRNHCGTCTTRCDAIHQCIGGSCVAGCPPGQIICDAACIDPATSQAYCGASGACTAGLRGVTCPQYQGCVASACLPASFLVPYTSATSVVVQQDTVYTLDAGATATIFYTLDGSDPTTSATRVSAPAPVSLGTVGGTTTIRWFARFGTRDEAPHTFVHTTSTAMPQDLGLSATNVSLNGAGPDISVAAGATVTGTLDLAYWRSTDSGYCPGCVVQAAFGIDGIGREGCVDYVSNVYPGDTQTFPFTVTAPTTPGIYFLRAGLDLEYDCSMVAYNGGWTPFAVLHVH